MFAFNNFSPIPALVAMYENYGTLTDRDYVISVSGKQQNKTFSVVPMDKVKFRNEKAKPYSQKSVLKMIDKAWPDENATDDEDEDEAPTRGKKKPVPKSSKKKQEYEDDDYEEDDYDADDFGDDDEGSESDYENMSAVELFKLCKDRGIEAAKRKPEKYYTKLLEEDDKAHNDWDDEDEDDEWEEE